MALGVEEGMKITIMMTGVVLCLTVAGCGDAEPGSPGDDLFGDGEWRLTSATLDGATLPLFDDYPVTLTRTGDEVGGRSACNHYFGTVSGTGGDLRFDGLGGTEMACMEPGVMELEAAYLSAVARVTGATRRGDDLVLSGDGVELVYTPVPPEPDADLAGTTWVLDTLLDGETASSAVGDSQATLQIGDERAEGTTGCNSFGGSAGLAAGRLELRELAVTEAACEGVMDQEGQVLEVLQGSPAVQIQGSRLTLLLDNGRGLVYRAEG